MMSVRALADRLFGNGGLRLRRRERARRPARDQRLAVAAEIAMLEPRCLLSTVAAGGHHIETPVAKHHHLKAGSNTVSFAGYQWYTNYHYNADSGYYDNGQVWAPQNVFVRNGHLQLRLRPATVGGSTALSSAEAVLVAKGSGQPFNPGYGTYLVSAKTVGSFNRLASNDGAIFGAFTYENLDGVGTTANNTITGLPASLLSELQPGMLVNAVNYQGNQVFPANTVIAPGGVSGGTITLNNGTLIPGLHTVYFTDNTLVNGHRELDMVEASRFGLENRITNAQFTLQPYSDDAANVHHIKISRAVSNITLVMSWPGPNTPVTFSQYNGIYTLKQIQGKTPSATWTTAASQDVYIPNNGHQTFHLNLWRADWAEPPTPTSEQVTVMNFQYKPLSS